jgi:hypothetical protein
MRLSILRSLCDQRRWIFHERACADAAGRGRKILVGFSFFSLLKSGTAIALFPGMQRWQLVAEALLLAVLIGSVALMRTERLIFAPTGVERGSSAQLAGPVMRESAAMPKK